MSELAIFAQLEVKSVCFLRTSLICIVGELVAGGSVAVAFGLSDM